MELRIAIVDDLAADRMMLATCIENFFAARPDDTVQLTGSASAEEFLPTFTTGSFDVVFLDICMNEMNGIELAQKLRNFDTQLMIVFQTTNREYAFDAFPVHPFDYLIKPCTQEAVNEVLTEVLRVHGAGDPEITVNAARVSYTIPLRTIIAITSSGHNTQIALTNKQQLVCAESFKKIMSKLDNDARFLTINRGITINMDHVRAPEEGDMLMKNGARYPLRVNGRARVLADFSQYMISKIDTRG